MRPTPERPEPATRRGGLPAPLALALVGLLMGAMFAVSPSGVFGSGRAPKAGARRPRPAATKSPMVVLGFNDLGMHCMNQDDSELCLLPPFNNLHAQVIDRSGEEPKIVKGGVQVAYSVPGNTTSAGNARVGAKTNFWLYAKALFGVTLPPDVGLTGNRLSGFMTPTANGDWAATGIPITPLTDAGVENAYQLATVVASRSGKVQGTTQAVVPVSWEISCNLCHNTPGVSVATDILTRHDRLHGTNLVNQKPVLCGGCHADPALNTAGKPGVSMLSHAMHGSHANRMAPVLGVLNGVSCYACHPGMKTQCQRDVHYARGITCEACHGNMAAVGSKARTPWVSEPKCATCHQARKPRFAFEEPGKLFKESRGHNGVMCAACHGSPHAITPTVTAADNVQAILQQGHAGTINDCTVCHRQRPGESFNHSLDD